MNRNRKALSGLVLLAGILLTAGCQEQSNEASAEIKGVAPPPASVSGIDTSSQQKYAESMKTKMGNPYQQGGYPGASGRR